MFCSSIFRHLKNFIMTAKYRSRVEDALFETVNRFRRIVTHHRLGINTYQVVVVRKGAVRTSFVATGGRLFREDKVLFLCVADV